MSTSTSIPGSSPANRYPEAGGEHHAGAEPREHHTGAVIACFIFGLIAVALAVLYALQTSATTEIRAQLSQANSEAAQTRADLSQAAAKSDVLQTQLDSVKSQQQVLQSDLGKAQAANASLQAQLGQSRTEVSSLQTAQGKDGEQLAALRAQLDQANGQSTALRSQLDQSSGKANDLNAQLLASQNYIAKLQPLAIKGLMLPVAVDFKKAFWTGKYTMQLRNAGYDPLTLDLAIVGSSPASSNSVVIDGKGTASVSHLAPGARVLISSGDLYPLNTTVR